MKRDFFKNLLEEQPYWLFVMFLLLVFVTGGSSRNDTQALAVLRPGAVLFFGLALWNVGKAQLVEAKLLLFGIGVVMLATIIYVIPLPASIWTDLPDRPIIAQIGKSAALGGITRTAAIDPSGAHEALMALIVPATALLLLVQINREGRYRILPLLIGLGLFSGLVGLMQSIGNPQGSLYFYQITNNGSAVGMFANRNHQAVLLVMIFPMLAAYVAMRMQMKSETAIHSWLSLAAAALLIPLILVTGSRLGLLLGVIALGCASWIYLLGRAAGNQSPFDKGSKWPIALGGVGVISLAAMTIYMSRAQAIDRIVQTDSESRIDFWQPIAEMAANYFPLGSGPGSFTEAHALIEPVALLDSTYLNHAHNDWLEYFSDYGILAVIIAVVLVVAGVIASFRPDRKPGRRDRIFSALGTSLLVIAALASFGDYPFRTPFMATVAAIVLVWTFPPPAENAKKQRDVPKMLD